MLKDISYIFRKEMTDDREMTDAHKHIENIYLKCDH